MNLPASVRSTFSTTTRGLSWSVTRPTRARPSFFFRISCDDVERLDTVWKVACDAARAVEGAGAARFDPGYERGHRQMTIAVDADLAAVLPGGPAHREMVLRFYRAVTAALETFDRP